MSLPRGKAQCHFQPASHYYFAVVAASKVAKSTFGVTGGVVTAWAGGAAVVTGGDVVRGVVPATRSRGRAKCHSLPSFQSNRQLSNRMPTNEDGAVIAGGGVVKGGVVPATRES